MDVLLTDRNFVSFAALTSSVLVTGVRQNVGGSIPETGMNLVVHGSRASDSLVTVEGMPIINGGGTGGLMYGNYPHNGLAQEITFQTDSHNAEFERATVYSNFIPKEGSNAFRGSFFGRWAGESWRSDNLSEEQMAQGLSTGNRIDRIWDVNPNVGGPIVRDRLWYGGFRHWGTYNTVAARSKMRTSQTSFTIRRPSRTCSRSGTRVSSRALRCRPIRRTSSTFTPTGSIPTSATVSSRRI